MAQKKDKNVKVRDLAPKKDAKGGVSMAGRTSTAGGTSSNAKTMAGRTSSGRTGLN